MLKPLSPSLSLAPARSLSLALSRPLSRPLSLSPALSLSLAANIQQTKKKCQLAKQQRLVVHQRRPWPRRVPAAQTVAAVCSRARPLPRPSVLLVTLSSKQSVLVAWSLSRTGLSATSAQNAATSTATQPLSRAAASPQRPRASGLPSSRTILVFFCRSPDSAPRAGRATHR